MQTTLIQFLALKNGVFQVERQSVCDKHLATFKPTELLNMHQSADSCELCAKEYVELEAAYREKQTWLPSLKAAFPGANTFDVRVYLSGPMQDMPDWNRPAFHRLERLVSFFGYKVVSPAYIDQSLPSYSAKFHVALHMLLRSECVVMMAGWKDSKGAVTERMVAKRLEKPIFYESI